MIENIEHDRFLCRLSGRKSCILYGFRGDGGTSLWAEGERRELRKICERTNVAFAMDFYNEL